MRTGSVPCSILASCCFMTFHISDAYRWGCGRPARTLCTRQYLRRLFASVIQWLACGTATPQFCKLEIALQHTWLWFHFVSPFETSCSTSRNKLFHKSKQNKRLVVFHEMQGHACWKATLCSLKDDVIVWLIYSSKQKEKRQNITFFTS